MVIALGIILIIALIYGPQYWVSHVLKKYSLEQEHFPGTGGELAQHLVERFQLPDVKVEKTETGDHYDPTDKTVRLKPDKFDGKSLTAITVAAHEVGHAVQHAMGYRPFTLRQNLAAVAMTAQKLGAMAMFAMPLLALASRSPRLGMVMLAIAVGSMLIGTLVHLVTLPVEWDASFKRALPILQQGEYLSDREMKHAHTILTAAALTYVAGSLASLLNLGRWIAILKR
jgi:Zn-dependent membrane protease YugP